MRVAHILRKYNAAEWGGTETALATLMDGLRAHDTSSVVFAPKLSNQSSDTVRDPYSEAGHEVRRYKAFMPVLGVSKEQRERLVGVGGNLMSVDLFKQLYRDKSLGLLHSHVLNRLGGVVKLVAMRRKIPFVVSIHGGKLDLPEAVLDELIAPLKGGFEYGKLFGALLGSRNLLADADAVVTCNEVEAKLLREQHPGQRILAQPHGVNYQSYQRDFREDAMGAFPALRGKGYCIMLGRIDEVKNHEWVVEQAEELFRRHPDLHLVFAGPTTSARYEETVRSAISARGFEGRIHLTGGFSSDDPVLLGLLQQARLLINASLSETFGMVFLEAWSSGTAVLGSTTSGAKSMIQNEVNGWLYEHGDAARFVDVVDTVMRNPEITATAVGKGQALVKSEFDNAILGRRLLDLYEDLKGKR